MISLLTGLTACLAHERSAAPLRNPRLHRSMPGRRVALEQLGTQIGASRLSREDKGELVLGATLRHACCTARLSMSRAVSARLGVPAGGLPVLDGGRLKASGQQGGALGWRIYPPPSLGPPREAHCIYK